MAMVKVCVVSSKAKQDFRVNPFLLSSNKGRPQLSHHLGEGRKGAVLIRNWP